MKTRLTFSVFLIEVCVFEMFKITTLYYSMMPGFVFGVERKIDKVQSSNCVKLLEGKLTNNEKCLRQCFSKCFYVNVFRDFATCIDLMQKMADILIFFCLHSNKPH